MKDKSRVAECYKALKDDMPNFLHTAAILAHQDVSRDEIGMVYYGAKAKTTKVHVLLAVNMEQAVKLIIGESGFNNCAEMLKQANKVIGYALYSTPGRFARENENVSTLFNDIKELNAQKDVVSMAIAWFMYLVSEKPLVDGNNELAFLVMNKILIENGYGYVHVPEESVRDFRDMVDSCCGEHPETYFILSQYLSKYCIKRI